MNFYNVFRSRFTGNKSVMTTVALLFNMSVSTVDAIITRVVGFLLELAPQVIRFPQTDEELQVIAEGFESVCYVNIIY